jgi:L-amino acid N-acyltransferase YncA
MSLWADYLKEREGNSIIEEPWGFIEYRLALPFMKIESIYVKPEERKAGRASLLADQVTSLAKEQGATHLWSQVWVGALNATASLKAILAYGFTVQGAENGHIILTKELTEDSNG